MTPVLYEVTDGVATITLASPDARNVLTAESLALQQQFLDESAADDSVRVVVLAAQGRAFCAGADLRSDSFTSDGPRVLARVLESLLDHPKPTIARVQGHVAGGGNGLVAACDLAVADEAVTFAFSEVRVGVAPAVIGVVVLPRLSARAAAELLLLGERVPARRAQEAGLITRVAAADGLDGVVAGWVDGLRAGGPRALSATKRLLREVPTLERGEAFDRMADLSAQLFSSAEAAEGMAAFIERREAVWPVPHSG